MHPVLLNYLMEEGWLTPDQVAAHRRTASSPQSWIGQLMVQHGLIGPEDINAILHRQDMHRGFFGENAMSLGYITRSQLDTLLAAQELRRNVEMLEELALSSTLDFSDGLAALAKFYAHRVSCQLTEKPLRTARTARSLSA